MTNHSGEMVEKVAQAIANSPGFPFLGEMEPFREAARAAIEAMREPTTRMSQSAWMVIPPTMQDADPELSDFADIYRAMIDAALQDPK